MKFTGDARLRVVGWGTLLRSPLMQERAVPQSAVQFHLSLERQQRVLASSSNHQGARQVHLKLAEQHAKAAARESAPRRQRERMQIRFRNVAALEQIADALDLVHGDLASTNLNVAAIARAIASRPASCANQ